jgi:hypothetical protein
MNPGRSGGGSLFPIARDGTCAVCHVTPQTGDLLQTQQAMWVPEANAIPITTTHSDNRESTEIGKRMIEPDRRK